jgi:conjugative transfer region protein TrbK
MNKVAAFLVIALIGFGAVSSRAQDKQPADPPQTEAQKELQRCSKLSIEDRQHDSACDAAARVEAQRFIGNGTPNYKPVPVNPFPGVPDAPFKPSTPHQAPSAGQQ